MVAGLLGGVGGTVLHALLARGEEGADLQRQHGARLRAPGEAAERRGDLDVRVCRTLQGMTKGV